jgi:hypothetical protein
LEILNEGTVGYHEAIAKTQTLKKPCDHEWTVLTCELFNLCLSKTFFHNLFKEFRKHFPVLLFVLPEIS